MSESRILVAAVWVLSAVACGGSARLEGGAGGAGAEAGTAPGHAGAPPGAAGAPSPGGAPNAGGASPGSAGSPSAGSPSAGSSGAGGDGSCALGDIRYPNGASWACDCNTCFCQNGSIGSTAIACAACQYGGKGYFVGESMPALDGCNTCTCEASGMVACTEKACACHPGVDKLHYILTDPHQCELAEYECPANTTPFQNGCGCGCAQAADCPPSIDCLPGPTPSDCEYLRQRCPYSPIAL
jgi:hypothetical protein